MSRMRAIAVAARMAGRRARVLLHSGRDDDGCGRYSFAACEPVRSLQAWGDTLLERDHAGVIVRQQRGDVLTAVANLVASAARIAPPAPGVPVPLAIGYLGYELGWQLESIGPGPTVGDDVADGWVAVYDALWIRDERQDREWVVGVDAAARARLEARLGADHGPENGPLLGALHAEVDGHVYAAQVDSILQRIAAGAVYQVNLARRLTAPVLAPGDPLAVYAALAEIAPAPFGALVESDGMSLISGSPERFLERRAKSCRLETRPIKGTRRRTGEAQDAARRRELAADPKELAEHLMIVDLERNDLGRIAEIGSVAVHEFARVVELPTLLHLVSTVVCRSRPDLDLADILRATFPGGSITGAPKIAAMKCIDELEPARRGPYTGAIGYWGADGALDLSIAIRCAVLTPAELRLHVGGGIVADSTAARELEETEEKAAAWRRALRQFEPVGRRPRSFSGATSRPRET